VLQSWRQKRCMCRITVNRRECMSARCLKRTFLHVFKRNKHWKRQKSWFPFCFGLQMDLMPFVSKAGCECLNESDDCGFDNCLIKDSTYMESDCDGQVRAAHSRRLATQMCGIAIKRTTENSVCSAIICLPFLNWKNVSIFFRGLKGEPLPPHT